MKIYELKAFPISAFPGGKVAAKRPEEAKLVALTLMYLLLVRGRERVIQKKCLPDSFI
jgi:hypothetical protein